jgi:hypothetical protein
MPLLHLLGEQYGQYGLGDVFFHVTALLLVKSIGCCKHFSIPLCRDPSNIRTLSAFVSSTLLTFNTLPHTFVFLHIISVHLPIVQ